MRVVIVTLIHLIYECHLYKMKRKTKLMEEEVEGKKSSETLYRLERGFK